LRRVIGLHKLVKAINRPAKPNFNANFLLKENSDKDNILHQILNTLSLGMSNVDAKKSSRAVYLLVVNCFLNLAKSPRFIANF